MVVVNHVITTVVTQRATMMMLAMTPRVAQAPPRVIIEAIVPTEDKVAQKEEDVDRSHMGASILAKATVASIQAKATVGLAHIRAKAVAEVEPTARIQ